MHRHFALLSQTVYAIEKLLSAFYSASTNKTERSNLETLKGSGC